MITSVQEGKSVEGELPKTIDLLIKVLLKSVLIFLVCYDTSWTQFTHIPTPMGINFHEVSLPGFPQYLARPFRTILKLSFHTLYTAPRLA